MVFYIAMVKSWLKHDGRLVVWCLTRYVMHYSLYSRNTENIPWRDVICRPVVTSYIILMWRHISRDVMSYILWHDVIYRPVVTSYIILTWRHISRDVTSYIWWREFLYHPDVLHHRRDVINHHNVPPLYHHDLTSQIPFVVRPPCKERTVCMVLLFQIQIVHSD